MSLTPLALALVGCPAYEDGRSGTYRRAADGEAPMAIELFRSGDFITGMVRTYRVARDEPFKEQLKCEWSALDAPFDEEALEFTLTLPRTSAQSDERKVKGRFLDDTRLSVTFPGEQAKIFELASETPDRRCEQARSFLLHADLSAATNVLPTTAHVLRRPVFSLLWLGVEPVQQGETIVWVGINRAGSAVYLGERNFSTTSNGLMGSLTLTIPAPQERDLVRSGQTRFALAHLVVLDDRDGCPEEASTPCAAAERLSWSVASEPIVASALEPLDAGMLQPDGAIGKGKAVLYVEGDLLALDPMLRARITNLDAFIAQGLTRERFYIVEVTHDADTILRLTLPEDPLNRRVRLKTTQRYLRAQEIPLPRLFPF